MREVLAAHGLPAAARALLLAQPRVLGHVFNPVSFWLCEDAAGALRVVHRMYVARRPPDQWRLAVALGVDHSA